MCQKHHENEAIQPAFIIGIYFVSISQSVVKQKKRGKRTIGESTPEQFYNLSNQHPLRIYLQTCLPKEREVVAVAAAVAARYVMLQSLTIQRLFFCMLALFSFLAPILAPSLISPNYLSPHLINHRKERWIFIQPTLQRESRVC